MSDYKYSPTITYEQANRSPNEFIYNAVGEVASEVKVGVDIYNEEIHFANYDKDGFDSYGYSSRDINGVYVGIGNGVDRNGFTQAEYESN